MSARLTVALAGNPNAGKTTIFNALTGARQHVGNYPGVTVEKKEGVFERDGVTVTMVDLPGIYSLSAGSPEETVARRFLLDERPDLVVQVLDASNLERNLYLAVQIMELGLPMVLAFNMSDRARAGGLEFDLQRLSALLDAPIIQTVASRGEGMAELAAAVVAPARRHGEQHGLRHLSYGPDAEAGIALIEQALTEAGEPAALRRWTALKLFENDPELRARHAGPKVAAAVQSAQDAAHTRTGDTPEMLVAGRRYGFISGACTECVRGGIEWRHTRSDRADEILTHPVLGVPIFLALMYAVFYVTFTLGRPLTDGLDWVFRKLAATVSGFWPAGADSALESLLTDGVIGGVGGVLSFVPNIALLFAAIAILEDSGYMARAAFIMDRAMHRIGLHGRSFIPLLIGFGCTVPAILATRTLETRRDRLTTMLVLPLISCGARLPIYALLIPAFFPDRWQAPALWLIYLVGIALAVAAARLLRSTLLRGEADPFVMELPPYRAPTLRGVLIHMGERGWLYVRKAGTIILSISVVLWALTSFPRLPAVATQGMPADERAAAELAHSAAGRLGHALEPVLRPMGFDWRIGTAMIGAFAAKEVFVAQLGIVFAVGDTTAHADSLRSRLRAAYSPLSGFCMMLFMLIGLPCVATVAASRRESGGWGWALLQLGGLTVLAWAITTAVYQVGRLVGGPGI